MVPASEACAGISKRTARILQPPVKMRARLLVGLKPRLSFQRAILPAGFRSHSMSMSCMESFSRERGCALNVSCDNLLTLGFTPGLSLQLEVLPGVVDDLVEGRGFRRASPVVPEPSSTCSACACRSVRGIMNWGASELGLLRIGIQAIFQWMYTPQLAGAAFACPDSGFGWKSRRLL